ncbi:glycosyltransferase [Porphyromonadaceae bacterium W3.11]|nr:glycosyltransferase [Porphyromonadaceae bacterium W3.11]
MDISFIIPIYNRPSELRDLLESFSKLQSTDIHYEIIIVEDGSTNSSAFIAQEFQHILPIKYIQQSNTGPGGARNRGAKEATGEYLHFLDSDTILPPLFLRALVAEMQLNKADLFGGPDRAADNFTAIQKAINFSMTSLFTSGGIRGAKKSVDSFYPRTFNMGIRRSIFEQLGGFRKGMRYGEDLDLSMRAIEAGYRSALYPEAWLYHKRRVTYSDFFQQVRHSGRARIILDHFHPGTLKPVHYLPTIFVIINVLSVFGVFIPFILLYALLIFISGSIQMDSMNMGLHAVAATYVQHFGYGIGFMEEYWNRRIKK